MADELTGGKVAFLVANEGVEQVELTEPCQAVRDAGAQPVLIAAEGGTIHAFHHLDRADTFEADLDAAGANADDYVGLVLPGGVANPDFLRTHDASVALVRGFAASGRPIAVICHGPWTLIEADVVDGRRMTSWPSLQTDLRNAGADWVDEEVVVCHGGSFPLVSSRKPDDLPAFCEEFVAAFSESMASPRR